MLEPQLTRLYGSDSLNLWGASTSGALSPDGRWVVFNTVEGADRMNLWIASVEDGDATRLTEGNEFNGGARWFPSGDRIAFRSSRFARGRSSTVHIVSLGIDPGTGQPTGPIRQVTLDPTWGGGFAISPDGKWIAYTSSEESAAPGFGWATPQVLKILPSTGGSARTLAARRYMKEPRWSADGKSVYFLSTEESRVKQYEKVMRVFVEDGRVEEVSSWLRDRTGSTWLSPSTRHICRRSGDEYELASLDGQPAARFTLPRGMSLSGFGEDGRTLLATMGTWAAPLRVLPVNGGRARLLNDARSWDRPAGWTADGENVLFGTRLNGEHILMRAPLDGGPQRQLALPIDSAAAGWGPVLGPDGRYAFYVTSEGEASTLVAKIRDLETGVTREVSRSLWADYVRFNLLEGDDQFLYAEDHGDRLDLRAVRPTEPSRLIGSFTPDEFPDGFALHGDRIVFARPHGNQTTLLTMVAGSDDIREVFTHPGQIVGVGMWRPEFSPDGSMLALSYAEMPSEPGLHREGYDVMLVRLSANGELIGEPRIVTLEPGPKWWALLRWLPDASGFLVLGMGAEPSMMDAEIWLVSLDPKVEPVALTADDPGSVWWYELSPDGKHVAYSSEIPIAGSIWKVELEGEW